MIMIVYIKNVLEILFNICFHEYEEYSIWEPYQENSRGECYCCEVFYKQCKKCGKRIKL
jgi:hypothetical protein